ncbi:MAG: putative peptidoglycan glycosyltransferase FtsW [Patescibacteria group bacterium]
MKKPSLRTLFLILSLLLSILGIIFVFESSVAESYREFSEAYHYVRLQSIRLFIGIIAMFIFSFIPTSVFKKFSLPFYLLSVAILLATLIPGFGVEIHGAKRWLAFGNFYFQPVEILKLSLASYFASWMSKHQRLPPFLLLLGVPALILILQPDLGSILVLLSIAFAMYFAAGAKLNKFLGLIMAGVILLSFAILSSDYRKKRLMTFLDPTLDPLGASFHIRQITLALGGGSWFGQGIGKSRQKYAYIPESSTDSIFAIIAEEIGFFGSTIILFLFASYVHLGFKMVRKQKNNKFNYLFGIGLLIWVSSQILLNLAAVVALVPLTGLPLPFFSYGGSSLIMILIATGIILGLSKKKT